MNRALSALKRHWGFGLFSLLSLVGLVRVLRSAVPGHYWIFTGAAQALSAGMDAYGTDYGSGVGLWFYSPTCGLLFFRPLSWLSENVGITVYMLLSWVLFVVGVRAFLQVLPGSQDLEQRGRRAYIVNLFWALTSPQMMLAILATKLEIFMTGLLLLSLTWIVTWTGRHWRFFAAAAALSLLVNFKFQPLPTVGLVILAWLVSDWVQSRKWRPALRFAALWSVLLAGWFAIPFLLFPLGYAWRQHLVWQSTLGNFVQEAWLSFDNLFVFIQHGLGLHFSYAVAQVILGVVAVASAGVVFLKARKGDFRSALALSVALGSMFTMALSPLNQNNAYILYAPLLLVALFAFERSEGGWRSAWLAVLCVSVGIMLFAYSDVMPVSSREGLRHIAVKSLSSVSLAIMVAVDSFGNRRSRSAV